MNFRTRMIAVSMSLALASIAGAQTKQEESAPVPNKPSNIASKVNYSTLADAFDYDQVIVYFNEASRANSDATELFSQIDAASARSGSNLEFIRTISTGGQLIQIRANANTKGDAGKVTDAVTQQVMEAFAADASVSSVEPNSRMQALFTPNDTSYAGSQWHYFEATGGLNLPTAWDSATGTGVVVAVIDTGITQHSDLNANIVAGYDFISDATAARDGNGRDSNPADQGDWWTNAECGPAPTPANQNSSWHGTHVAGTIAAVSNNAKGVAGVAFNAKVSPLRVLGKCGGSIADIADAINWASGGTVSGVPANANVAKVINMSLGGGGACGTTTQTAINSSVSRGTVVVVAAGNSNTNASGFNPANCNNVVAVAATNRAGGRSYYSNFGALVDVAAPGGELTQTSSTNGVYSTLNSGTTTPSTESYAFYQGTSMASPHVAGVAALILSKGTKTPAEVESLLKANTRPFPGVCSQCGSGIVDASKTLAALTTGGGTGTSFFQNITPVAIADLATINSTINVSGRTGNASASLQVAVNISHTYRGDLQIDLIAPNGTSFRLKNSSGSDSAANVVATFTVNASAVVANGAWRLQVRDVASGDVGTLNRWSLQF
jgi:serine protease